MANDFPPASFLEALDEPVQGLVVASPANPTGTMLTPEELAALAIWCESHGVQLISDEIYHGIEYASPMQHATAWQTSREAVVFHSFSKYFSMTGWRLGWMLVPERLRRGQLLNLLFQLRSTAHIIDMHQLTKYPDRIVDLQAGASDEAPVDVGLLHDARDVGGLDRPAVQDAHLGRRLLGERLGDLAADRPADLLRVVRGGDLAGADRPHRFVGDDELGDLVQARAARRDERLLGVEVGAGEVQHACPLAGDGHGRDGLALTSLDIARGGRWQRHDGHTCQPGRGRASAGRREQRHHPRLRDHDARDHAAAGSDHLRGRPVEKRVDTGVMVVTPENMETPEARDLINPPVDRYLGAPNAK